jgi:hypothetical protein
MSTRLPPRAGAGPDFAADDPELAALKQKIQRERGFNC